MKVSLITLFTCVTALFLTACESQEKTARNGLTYTVLREGEGVTANQGEFLILNMSYRTKATDSVWVDTAETMAQAFPQNDSLWITKDKDIQVIFAEMKTGDSVTFDVTIADFFANTVGTPVPPEMNPEELMQFNVGLQNIFNKDEVMSWYQEEMDKQRLKVEAEAEKQLDIDVGIIEEYLAENSVTAERTESGLFYEILEKGAGKQAETGSVVRVDYIGKTLDGAFFDSSIESVAKENDAFSEGRPYGPYELTLGQNSVIKGWEEGLTLLKEGDKARLYIPSTLAYGPQQRSEVIGPNSILVFDLELVEVK